MELSAEQMLKSVSDEQQQSGVEETPAASEAAPAVPELHEYVADGKTIKEPLEMLKKRAGMGYHYAQRMEAWNKEKEQILADLKRHEAENKTLSRWREYDSYAQQNPKWADHVAKMWEERERYTAPDPDDPVSRTLSEIRQTFEGKLSEQEKRIQEILGHINESRFSKENEIFSQEIKSVRDEYKDFDFDAPDESGKSLETRVLMHMDQNGIRNFKTAFRDFYHDQILAREREKIKETHAKTQAKAAKAGIMGINPTPTSSQQSSNGKYRTYDDAADAALRELGIN